MPIIQIGIAFRPCPAMITFFYIFFDFSSFYMSPSGDIMYVDKVCGGRAMKENKPHILEKKLTTDENIDEDVLLKSFEYL